MAMPTKLGSKRRGISQILGNLIILAMVTAIGTVILFHGMNEINAFNYELNNHSNVKNKKYQESVIFEHVHFEPGTSNLQVTIRNTGTIDFNIETIKVVKTDTQEILGTWTPDYTLFVKEVYTVPLLNALPSNIWDDAGYVDADYKITVTTARNNFFNIVASPFNT